MAKAHIKLPNGTDIAIEGSESEVSRILSFISGQTKSTPVSEKAGKVSTPSKKLHSSSGNGNRKPGLTTYVLELKDEGYFKKERTLEDVLEALRQKGRIYPVTSLSETMLRLLRQKKLGRIKNNENKWVYVHRD